jgi:hypothetical protein
MSDMKRTTLMISEEQKRDIMSKAAREGLYNFSDIVRKGLALYALVKDSWGDIVAWREDGDIVAWREDLDDSTLIHNAFCDFLDDLCELMEPRDE